MGGGEGRELKHLGALLYQARQFCACVLSLVIPSLPKRGQKYGRGGHSRLINETMLVCRVIGNVHTVAKYIVCTGVWLVESISWVCMLMGVI